MNDSARGGAAGEQTPQKNNLQRIAHKKQQLKTWPRNKKLEKLAVYSSCKNDNCKCNGWKNPHANAIHTSASANQHSIQVTDPCRTCNHQLSVHINHLENVNEDELNRLLGIVVDVENLFMCVHNEEDIDTKQVYFYLFKLLRKSIMMMTRPTVEGPLGNPPFENPSIRLVSQFMILFQFN